jgi:HAD superfamily hydrolase (TIGR01450 family)
LMSRNCLREDSHEGKRQLRDATLETPSALRGIRGMVFDLDGTLIRGGTAIPGAPETIAKLRAIGIGIVFCTQHTEYTEDVLAERIDRLGIRAGPADVVATGAAVAQYLSARYGPAPIRYIATPLQTALLQRYGTRLAGQGERSRVLLLGKYPGFSAADLETACAMVQAGADFLAVANDRTLPGEHGPIPCTGGIVRAVEYVTRRRARILGKPSIHIAGRALERLGLPAAEVMVVGDNAEVDVAMGKAAGCRTALVLSGATAPERVAQLSWRAKPDMILRDVTGLFEAAGSITKLQKMQAGEAGGRRAQGPER